ncbi:protein WHAT'S THIS FACTOR 1, chloroplastic [Cocos nucifera]|uniref:Protein WHAT'S THIS FACTOR 1, chloroplastic n=1 Tax=Cocos nucifera TaxID=13894 RepID=A0A8K0IWP4_COCNU|nr:protein WHAT'S THIS FACTOR 1, chloroplastic [Cocos nucifera]
MATRRSVALRHLLPWRLLDPFHPDVSPNLHILRRGLALWSMKKDPALEAALSRNRRWIVNNQIKHILLRSPNHTATVRSLQKKFKTLDLQGKALNWLQKYPCCFETFSSDDGEVYFLFSKRMAALVDEEEAVRASTEPAMARRLAKLLMLSRDRRLNVVKLNELKRNFGLPDDYIIRILPQYPDTFRVVNRYGRRNSTEIELVRWDPALAVSTVEAAAAERGTEPRYTCSLPPTWVKTRAKFDEFNDRTPYISPYSDDWKESEKRSIGVVHELLSLTLWKKASIVKLEHFKREFGLPERLNFLLLRQPCIFYVSNRYKIYTVVLREGYRGSELVEKDPLVVMKDKLGELMQEGLHEYNRRRRLANLEKKRKRGEIEVRPKEEEDEEDEVEALRLHSAEKREERKRFYKVLFDENP